MAVNINNKEKVMEMTRKPRGVLANLPAEVQAAIEEWMFDAAPTLTYEQARGRLMHEQGLDVSLDSLSRFYQRRAQERMVARMVATAQQTREVTEQCEQNGAASYEALMEMIGQAAFELRMKEGTPTMSELKEVAGLASMGMRVRIGKERVRLLAMDVAVKDRDVALRETKYKDQRAEEEARRLAEESGEKGGLTKESLALIEKQARIL